MPSSCLRRCAEAASMTAGLSLFALFCLFWLPFAALLNPLLPAQPAQILGRRTIAFGFRFYCWLLTSFCGFRFDLTAIDALRQEKSLIVIANHPSLLDAVLLTSRLPNAVCVMKASLMDNLLYGAAARLARYIRNDQPLRLVQDASAELQRGAHLILFPEGTRTTSFPLDPCTESAALLAKRSNVSLQTVLLEYSSPYLGKSWGLFRSPRLPLVVKARLGHRFAPDEDIRTLTRNIENHLRSELSACMSPEHPEFAPCQPS